jgi:dihydropteroate synthase
LRFLSLDLDTMPQPSALLGWDWSRPIVMGIVNATDDSFSGDGLAGQADKAIAQARAMVAMGADVIDLGAESTRPGAEAVSPEQEIARLLPIIAGLGDLGRPLSVDTRHAATMRAALAAGASIINDISALEDDPASLEVVAEARCPVVLMHKQGSPATMQQAPLYDDVVAEVLFYLEGRIKACEAAGIPRGRIVVDPGIGFGKTQQQNVALIRALPRFRQFGCAVLLGVSRKSVIGYLTGETQPSMRIPGSVAAALWAAEHGANILRVHDVDKTVQALQVWQGLAAMA